MASRWAGVTPIFAFWRSTHALPTALLFVRIRKVAGWLLVPYLLWLAFAAVLCWQIWQLNPDGAPVQPTSSVVELTMPSKQD